jgi:hypothetical protein
MIARAKIVTPTPISALAPLDKPCGAGGFVEVGFVGDVFVLPVEKIEWVVRLRSEPWKLSWNISAYIWPRS